MDDTKNATRIDWPSWAGLAFIALAFGSAFYFNELALRHFSPAFVGASRVILVGLTLIPACLALGWSLPSTSRQWGWAALYGLVGMLVPFYLLVWAQTGLPTNVASAFFATIPLFILLFSRVFLGVAITVRKAGGLLIGSAGLVYLAGPGTLAQIGDNGAKLPQLAMGGACVCFALNAIIARVMPPFPPVPMTGAAGAIAGLFALPIALATWPTSSFDPVAVGALLGVGIISTAIGVSVRFWLIRRRGPVFVTPNGYLAAIVGAIMGVVLLGETIAPQTAVAFAVIIAGLLIAEDGSGRMKQV